MLILSNIKDPELSSVDLIPSSVLRNLFVAAPPNLLRDPFIPQPVCAARTSPRGLMLLVSYLPCGT
jgi:hypothetical protein